MTDQAELRHVPLEQIRENPDALRNVNKESTAYAELVESVRERGVINPISLTPRQDENGNTYYLLVDGLHRYSAAKDAGLKTIQASIWQQSKQQVYENQIIANVHKIETRPVEYTKGIMRLLGMNPTVTSREMAIRLGKSQQWLNDRLSLMKLHESIRPMVDSGQIPLANAYQLAKLPTEEQANWIEPSMTKTVQEFTAEVGARVKKIRDDARQGRASGPAQFEAVAHYRTKKETETLLVNPSQIQDIIVKSGAKTPVDAAEAMVRWILKLDAESVAARKAEWDADQQAKKEAAEKRKKERSEKKKTEAAETAATVAGVP